MFILVKIAPVKKTHIIKPKPNSIIPHTIYSYLDPVGTALTNFIQCMERGRLIVHTPLDLKKLEPPPVQPTEPPAERTISGRYSYCLGCYLEVFHIIENSPFMK